MRTWSRRQGGSPSRSDDEAPPAIPTVALDSNPPLTRCWVASGRYVRAFSIEYITQPHLRDSLCGIEADLLQDRQERRGQTITGRPVEYVRVITEFSRQPAPFACEIEGEVESAARNIDFERVRRDPLELKARGAPFLE